MIIWKGLGILVLVIGFAIFVLTELIIESLTKNSAFYQLHGWPKLLALWLAAGCVWVWARYLNRRPGRVMIDKATGKEVVLRAKHELFFIDIQYWPYILAVLGVLFLFVKSST
jgi:hypothetical protein